MERYKNLRGDSGIIGYEIGADSIIEQMKDLAIAGQGLNSFISKVVRKRYASKLR